jgi:uncharacterized protein YxeA
MLNIKKKEKMKKLIFIIIAIFTVFVTNAQVAIVNAPLDLNNVWVKEYTGVATDTLGTVTATTWSWAVPVNKADGLMYVAKLKVSDKTTGAAGVCTIKMQGKYFEADAYTDITTVSWTGVGSTDTTAVFTSVSNKVYYRYLRILVTNSSGKSKIDFAKLLIKR